MMLKSPVSDVAYLTSAAIFNNPLNFAGIDQFVAPACYKMFVEAMQNSMPPSWLKEYDLAGRWNARKGKVLCWSL